MYRGLILGGIAFAAAFFAEKQFSAIGKDIDRYDKIRAMSGDLPLYRQGLTMVRDSLGSLRDARRGRAVGLFDAVQHDVLRYARISTM